MELFNQVIGKGPKGAPQRQSRREDRRDHRGRSAWRRDTAVKWAARHAAPEQAVTQAANETAAAGPRTHNYPVRRQESARVTLAYDDGDGDGDRRGGDASKEDVFWGGGGADKQTRAESTNSHLNWTAEGTAAVIKRHPRS